MLLSLVIGSYDAHIVKESALLDQFTLDGTDNLNGIFRVTILGTMPNFEAMIYKCVIFIIKSKSSHKITAMGF